MIVSVGLIRPAHADNAQYYYDPDGRLVGMVDPVNGSAYYNYDATGNILSVAVNPITAVSVVGFSPGMAAAGTVVTIGGTGFGTTANTTVNFNGKAATPSAVTATTITVKVPTGATTGPVTVTAPTGSATSIAGYIVTSALLKPTIASFSPTMVAPGSTITITGSNFDPINSEVEINGRLAAVVSATATTIVATVPARSSGHVTVDTPAGTATSTSDLIIAPPGFTASSVSSSQRVSFPASGASQAITASIATAGQIALVLFDGKPGEIASALVTSTTLTAGDVTLYGPDGAPVSPTVYDADGANFIPTISLVTPSTAFMGAQNLQQSGTYVMVITSSFGSGGSAGTTAMTIYNVPPLNPTTVTAGRGAGTSTLAVPGQIPNFTFSGTAGQAVRLITQAASSFSGNFTVTVTEPDGVTQLSSQTVNPDLGQQYLLTGLVTLPQTGSYLVQFFPTPLQTGAVTLQVDVPVTGKFSSASSALTETVSAPGDIVNLTFSGTAGQAVQLLTQPSSAFLAHLNTVTVTGPDGQTVLSSQQLNSNVGQQFLLTGLLTLPATGTYTVSFVPSAPDTGTVTFTLETPLTGTLTAGGAAVTETIAQPADIVNLSFAGTAGQVVRLVTQPSSAFLSSFDTVTITEPDGQTQLSSQTLNSNIGQQYLLTGLLTLPVTGTYSVKFLPSAPVTGTVTIQLDTPVSGAITAGGASVMSTITAPGDVVNLSFSGTAGQAVRLAVQPSSAFLSSVDMAAIIEPDGQTQLSPQTLNSNIGQQYLLSGVVVLPVTGTYTARFTPTAPVTGSVTMTVDLPVASMLTLGGPSVTTSSTEPGAVMTLSFAGTAGQQLRLVTQPSSAFLSNMDTVLIIEPDGQTQLYSQTLNSSIGQQYLLSGVLTLPTTGTYTAEFVPAAPVSGSVTMSLDQPIASTIAIGGPPVASAIMAPGDVVDLSFAGMVGQSVVLSTQPGSAFLSNMDTVTITEPDGQTQLYSQTLNSSIGQQYLQSGLLKLPSTGTYVAQFTPSGPATGSVTMQLSAPVTGTIAVGGPTVTTTTTAAGGVVQLSFAGTAGQPVQLFVQPSSALYAFADTVTIIEPDGQTQLLSQTTNPNTGQQSLLTGVVTLPVAGTYTLQFSPGGPGAGSVAMTLYDGGTSVTGATDFTASIGTPGASAQLAFSGSSGSRVSLLTAADTNLRQGCFTIALSAPGATTPLYSSTQSSPTDFSHALTLPASGLYTMLLTPCGSATGTAALTLYSVPPDVSGTTTIGGTAASLTTVEPGQNSAVTFPTSAAGQSANIAIAADAGFASACYSVTVTAPGGSVVNSGQGCGTGYSTGALTLGAAGTYSVTIASVGTAIGNLMVGVTAQ